MTLQTDYHKDSNLTKKLKNFVGDLVTLQKKKDNTDEKLSTVDDDDDEFKRTPSYKDYKDFPDYFSNQFKFPLQKKLVCKQEFHDIADQSQILSMPLQPLDIEKDVLDDFTVVLIGRRRSGKTWCARFLMYHLRFRFPFGVVITGTKQNKFWSDYVPEEWIHDIEDMNEVLPLVFRRQAFLKDHPELEIDHRMFLILDDVLRDKYVIRFSKALSTCFTDGRHHDIMTLITVQDPRGIPPDLRENTDLALIFRIYQKGRKQIVCEDYLDYIDNKDDRMKFLWQHTGKIDKNGKPLEEENLTEEEIEKGIPLALCVLQSRLTNNLQNIFKRMASEDPGEFTLGDPKYWKAALDGRWLQLVHTYYDFNK